jgi:hypothetical protein
MRRDSSGCPITRLIQRRVGDAYDVKRVSDLNAVGQHRVEHRPDDADRSNVA